MNPQFPRERAHPKELGRPPQKLAHWNYSQVSYDPANIGTFNSAIQTALAKHPNYVAEAGLPLTAQQINAVQSAGAKWMITAVYPVTVKPPIIAASNAYENDAEMGRVLAYYFVADSGGKGNAVIEHVPAYPILDAFTDAFTATVKSLCPACKTQFVNITLPDVAAGKISSDVVSALRSEPLPRTLWCSIRSIRGRNQLGAQCGRSVRQGQDHRPGGGCSRDCG